ncbi:MAG: acetate/propionate family kinase [Clostridia bacterium]|jgi:acetate kinase|nr:acetate/propionate family kinase [Clostridia bacterium]
MLILICNVGSTSLKFRLFDMPEERTLAESKIERVGSANNSIFAFKNFNKNLEFEQEKVHVPDYGTGINLFLQYLTDGEYGAIASVDEVTAVGFKTVHAQGVSGIRLLNEEVIQAMEKYISIAPLHNRFYVDAIRKFIEILPDKPMVGVFETAFHLTMPPEARTYGIPYEWKEKYGIQRYGFHGNSHRFITNKVREISGKEEFKLISCHLGGSSSITAVKDGESLENSFGFSLQSGLSHANRAGDIDPYILVYLMKEEGYTLDQVLDDLTKRGGMYGISGVSNDLRDIQKSAEEGNARAKLAIDVFCYEIRKFIGSYYAILGGLDYLVFTGGIGENSVMVREKVCTSLAHLGIKIDLALNREGPKERFICAQDSPVKVLVAPTNEEIGIARDMFAFFN